MVTAPASHSQTRTAKPAPPQDRPPTVERITNTLFRVGKVMVDTVARQVVCNGVINMDSGAIEYLAVSPGGKLHESLLKIEARPIHLQVALILLNLEPHNNLKYQGDSATPLGAPLSITIRWKDLRTGAQRSERAEALISEMPLQNKREKDKEKNGGPHNWVFTGSRVLKEVGFEADAEGSIIAVWHDPAAIIDNPSPDGAENNHSVSRSCPPRNTPIELVITAANSAPAAGR